MTAIGPGVRVKCVCRGPWTLPDGSEDSGPSFGTVWTVAHITERFDCTFFTLVEWTRPIQFFLSTDFVPLDGNEDISSLIEAAKKGPVDSDERVRVVEPT